MRAFAQVDVESWRGEIGSRAGDHSSLDHVGHLPHELAAVELTVLTACGSVSSSHDDGGSDDEGGGAREASDGPGQSLADSRVTMNESSDLLSALGAAEVEARVEPDPPPTSGSQTAASPS